jgi:D-alanyl-D-alanine carboxypeptidase/D-alanyl-D-alanine-endopeptidase (penicillin-binding protein 4)
MRKRLALSLLSLLLAAKATPLFAQELDLKRLLKNGGARVEREDGSPLLRYRDTDAFVPASILKVATTFCALENLGRDFRFVTAFYRGSGNTLFIRGSGDPSLVSEELNEIGLKVATLMPRINRIVIDPSLFSPDIDIDGSSTSLNPYDSKVAAFVGNFSSAALMRRKDGSIISAEPQTPLTPLSRQAGMKLKRGTSERINLGHTWRVGTLYGGELLAQFLQRAGASGAMTVDIGTIPADATKIYEHRSSKDLAEISQGLLKYSTNFTANQIFLTLGIQKYGAPATVEKSQRAMTECLERKVGWKNFYIEEGSGLSRKNSVSPAQMTQLLKHFEPYQDLLNVEDGFAAKTGSLRGVNTLAGYFELAPSYNVRFAILVNSDVEHSYKFKIARALREHLRKTHR